VTCEVWGNNGCAAVQKKRKLLGSGTIGLSNRVINDPSITTPSIDYDCTTPIVRRVVARIQSIAADGSIYGVATLNGPTTAENGMTTMDVFLSGTPAGL
jgi:hypothetical protein